MKIIHVLKGKANPHTMNGVNKVVHHLATEQMHLGHNVEVWGITSTPDIIRHEHDYILKLFSATRGRFFLSDMLIQAIDSIAPEDLMVHLHSVFLPELFAVSRRLRKNSVPWVLSPHSGYNPYSMKKNGFAKLIYMMFFEKNVILSAKRVHAIGTSEVDDLYSISKSLDVVLIPNGQSFDEVTFSAISCDEPQERPLFGFCGRLAKNHKGLDLLIQGFAEYKKRLGGKGQLWLIGDGPDYRLLNELVDTHGVEGSVKFLGTLFGDSKLTCLKKIDIFVHTSRWEGMPMAVLEAAALGKPLLVSEATNMAGYVRKYGNGIVLDENTPEDIGKAMFTFSELHRDQKNEAIGRASIKLVEEKFSWQTIAETMVEKLYT